MSTRGHSTGGGLEVSSTSNTINVVIAGVGGQGVLTLAEILAKSALADSHNVRVGEIHGMAQRGGHVVCTVRIGSDVHGPIIDPGTAHLLVGFEPVETLREAHLVSSSGTILMSSHVQYPVAVSMGKAEYPSHDTIHENLQQFSNQIMKIDAMKLAIDAGSPRSLNMVMLGAILGTGIVPVIKKSALESIRTTFSKRFEGINTKAVELGISTIKGMLG
jgi:indolepyruvate ferredoxin oxidoreductase beta subunit